MAVAEQKVDLAKKMLDGAHDAYEQGGSGWSEPTAAMAFLSMATSLYEIRTWAGALYGQMAHPQQVAFDDEPIATAPPEPVTELSGRDVIFGDPVCRAKHHEYGMCQLLKHERWPIHLFRLDDGTLYPVAMGGEAVVTDKGPDYNLTCPECGSADPEIRRYMSQGENTELLPCDNYWHTED